MKELCILPVHAGLLLDLPWKWRRHIPPKVGWLSPDNTAYIPEDKTVEVYFTEHIRKSIRLNFQPRGSPLVGSLTTYMSISPGVLIDIAHLQTYWWCEWMKSLLKEVVLPPTPKHCKKLLGSNTREIFTGSWAPNIAAFFLTQSRYVQNWIPLPFSSARWFPIRAQPLGRGGGVTMRKDTISNQIQLK
jgi:hypothetical protein